MSKYVSVPDQEYLAALDALRRSLNVTGAGQFLFFSKGSWYFGGDQEELPVGTRLILDCRSFQTGFIAWHLREIEGEVMYPIDKIPNDVKSSLFPVQAKNGWQPQLACSFWFEGDSDTVMQFKTSSMGGFDAIRGLLTQVQDGLNPPKAVYPRVELGVDFYEHKEHGKVYKPLLEIVSWLPLESPNDLI